MTLQVEALIKERLLAGCVTAEIAKELTWLLPQSASVYISNVRKKLTEKESIEAKKAKGRRIISRAIDAANTPCLSDTHRRIGLRISKLRFERRMAKGEFCKYFKFGTTGKISKMENGDHNFTLTELMALSEILSIEVGALASGSF